MQPVDLKCANCGAALYGVGAGPIRCNYCGHMFEIPRPAAPPPEVVRIEIVAPGTGPGMGARPVRRSGAGCGALGVLPALIFAGVIGFVVYRSGASSSTGGIGIPVPALNERALWDEVGGQPIPFTGAGPESAIGRMRLGTKDELFIVSVDPAKAAARWKFGPLGTYSEGYQHTHFAVRKDKVLVSDAKATVHVVDGASGKELKSAHFTDKIERICIAEPGDIVWVGTIDRRGATLDVDTGATHEAARPASCGDAPMPVHHAKGDKTASPPTVPGFDAEATHLDGDIGVLSGHKSPGTKVPLAVGFDPKTGAVRWNEPVASSDPSRVRDESNGYGAIAAGKFFTAYGVASKGWHLVALDAKSGARMWDVAMPVIFAVDSLHGIAATGSYVYVVRTSSLDVYDAKSGNRIGAVGNETYER